MLKSLAEYCFTASILVSLLIPSLLPAETTHTRVAVASNFVTLARDIARDFELATGTTVSISSASSGKLYAQIRQGAPFDILLSADALRPDMLVEGGHAVDDSKIVYALGRLVFWSPAASVDTAMCKQLLYSQQLKRLAMANPEIAPYGLAAKQTLENLAIQSPSFTIIRGENIGQTYAFVHAGGVDAGFIAASQWLQGQQTGCSWKVEDKYHAPIEQKAVLLKSAKNQKLARRFLEYLASESVQRKIRLAGYSTIGEQ